MSFNKLKKNLKVSDLKFHFSITKPSKKYYNNSIVTGKYNKNWSANSNIKFNNQMFILSTNNYLKQKQVSFSCSYQLILYVCKIWHSLVITYNSTSSLKICNFCVIIFSALTSGAVIPNQRENLILEKIFFDFSQMTFL